MNKRYIYALVVSFIMISGCEKSIDNYEAPNAGVYGAVIDKLTNEPIPLPVGKSSGALVSLYEQNDDATVAITTRAKSDGTYGFSTMFNGTYRVNVDGPYIGLCEGYVDVKGQTEFNLYALPFSRIDIDASVDNDNVVTLHYKAVKTDASFALSDVSVLWNYTPEVDNNSTYYAMKISMGTADSSTCKIDLYNDAVFAENHYRIVANDNKIYVRVSATVNSVVNYSKVIALQVK